MESLRVYQSLKAKDMYFTGGVKNFFLLIA